MSHFELRDLSASQQARIDRLVRFGYLGTAILALISAMIGIAGGRPVFLLTLLVTVLFALNIAAVLAQWRQHIPYLLFHGALLLFLLFRPWVTLIWGLSDDRTVRAGTPSALIMLAVSLAGLRLGQLGYDFYRRAAHPGAPVSEPRIGTSARFRLALFALFIVAAVCELARSVEALLFVLRHSYALFYTDFTSSLPGLVPLIGSMSPFLLAGLLAFFPPIRLSLISLGIFLITTVPTLAMGQRGPIIELLAFGLAYVLLRTMTFTDRPLRIQRRYLVALAVAIPLVIIAMSWINTARFNDARSARFDPITDFAYSQSVTFNVVARAAERPFDLPHAGVRAYAIGPMTDYVLHGMPAQRLFGAEPLGGNTVQHALQGHSFSHAYSYANFRTEYLAGRGSGSSYLIELFLDTGFLGVLLYSVALGMLLRALATGYSRNWFLNMGLLVMLQGIFMLPRSSASNFLVFLLLPHFWAPVIAIAVLRLLDARLPARQRA